MTNAIPLIQTAAQQAGYNLSGEEIAAIAALAGGAVHVLHQICSAWTRVGGKDGFTRWFKTGKPNP